MVRKLALMMDVSLDGLVARPGKFGAGGWGLPPEDAALKARKLGWLRDTGLHLMGRATYEEMAGFWPSSDDEYAAPMVRSAADVVAADRADVGAAEAGHRVQGLLPVPTGIVVQAVAPPAWIGKSPSSPGPEHPDLR